MGGDAGTSEKGSIKSDCFISLVTVRWSSQKRLHNFKFVLSVGRDCLVAAVLRFVMIGVFLGSSLKSRKDSSTAVQAHPDNTPT